MDRGLVTRRRVIDTAKHVEVVNPLSQQRKMLTALVARDACGNLFELTTNFSWRIRFQIPRVVVRAPALKQNDDGSFGRRTGLLCTNSLRSTQRVRQRERTHR